MTGNGKSKADIARLLAELRARPSTLWELFRVGAILVVERP